MQKRPKIQGCGGCETRRLTGFPRAEASAQGDHCDGSLSSQAGVSESLAEFGLNSRCCNSQSCRQLKTKRIQASPPQKLAGISDANKE